jgi:ATP-dependent DNA helicase RecG
MARNAAQNLLQEDPDLAKPQHARTFRQIKNQKKHAVNWSRIS